MRKKILAVVLCVALLIPVLGLVHGFAVNTAELRFSDDGTFKILQVTDLQDGDHLDLRVRRYLQALAEPEDPNLKPDLIILTGDNIEGAITGAISLTQAAKDAATKTAIDQYMRIFEHSGVPVASVFGNHDAEGALYIGYSAGKEKQLAWYQAYSNFIGMAQDPTYENQNLSGVGNYNLPILSKDGSAKVSYNVWLFDAFDSGSTSPYDGVHDDVLDWYTWKSEQLKAANGGQWVPSVAFQHVIVPEVYTAMEEAGRKVDTTVPAATGDYIWEDPCPNSTNTNQFARLKDRDVKAMFFGHDHNNNFLIPYQGIDLICTGGTCFGDRGLQVLLAYNRAHDATARLITLHEDDPGNIETQTLFYSAYEKAGLIQELKFEQPLTVQESLRLFFDSLQAVILTWFDKLLIKLAIV
jgi:hypothetical protein